MRLGSHRNRRWSILGADLGFALAGHTRPSTHATSPVRVIPRRSGDLDSMSALPGCSDQTNRMCAIVLWLGAGLMPRAFYLLSTLRPYRYLISDLDALRE